MSLFIRIPQGISSTNISYTHSVADSMARYARRYVDDPCKEVRELLRENFKAVKAKGKAGEDGGGEPPERPTNPQDCDEWLRAYYGVLSRAYVPGAERILGRRLYFQLRNRPSDDQLDQAGARPWRARDLFVDTPQARDRVEALRQMAAQYEDEPLDPADFEEPFAFQREDPGALEELVALMDAEQDADDDDFEDLVQDMKYGAGRTEHKPIQPPAPAPPRIGPLSGAPRPKPPSRNGRGVNNYERAYPRYLERLAAWERDNPAPPATPEALAPHELYRVQRETAAVARSTRRSEDAAARKADRLEAKRRSIALENEYHDRRRAIEAAQREADYQESVARRYRTFVHHGGLRDYDLRTMPLPPPRPNYLPGRDDDFSDLADLTPPQAAAAAAVPPAADDLGQRVYDYAYTGRT